jgi:hypothetical protein
MNHKYGKTKCSEILILNNQSLPLIKYKIGEFLAVKTIARAVYKITIFSLMKLTSAP